MLHALAHTNVSQPFISAHLIASTSCPVTIQAEELMPVSVKGKPAGSNNSSYKKCGTWARPRGGILSLEARLTGTQGSSQCR
jgi:hypothetical protein